MQNMCLYCVSILWNSCNWEIWFQDQWNVPVWKSTCNRMDVIIQRKSKVELYLIYVSLKNNPLKYSSGYSIWHNKLSMMCIPVAQWYFSSNLFWALRKIATMLPNECAGGTSGFHPRYLLTQGMRGSSRTALFTSVAVPKVTLTWTSASSEKPISSTTSWNYARKTVL